MNNKGKKIIIVVLIMAIVIVLALTFYRKHESERRVSLDQEYFTPAADQNSSFAGAAYTGELLHDQPQSLPLIDVHTISYNDLAAKAGNYCQIYEADDYGEHYGNNCDFSLYPDGHIQMVEFSDNLAGISSVNSSPLSLERAQRTAEAFLANFYGDNSQLAVSSFTPLVCGDVNCHMPEDDLSLANAVELTYARQYQNVPLVTRMAGDSYISVMVDSDDHIIKAELETNTPAYEVGADSYPLLSVGEAVANINHNQAVLYDYDDSDYYEDNSGQVVNVDSLYNLNLTSVFLDYQMNNEQTQAVPTYNFYGKAQDINGNVMNVIIYTPAIQFEVASDNSGTASI